MWAAGCLSFRDFGGVADDGDGGGDDDAAIDGAVDAEPGGCVLAAQRVMSNAGGAPDVNQYCSSAHSGAIWCTSFVNGMQGWCNGQSVYHPSSNQPLVPMMGRAVGNHYDGAYIEIPEFSGGFHLWVALTLDAAEGKASLFLVDFDEGDPLNSDGYHILVERAPTHTVHVDRWQGQGLSQPVFTGQTNWIQTRHPVRTEPFMLEVYFRPSRTNPPERWELYTITAGGSSMEVPGTGMDTSPIPGPFNVVSLRAGDPPEEAGATISFDELAVDEEVP